ncbi:MAG TPA: ABC transporter permease [Gemmatimonadaceae bacterium]|nr:ABC transporter permease [Gemmatimonadaceae bacterium]
MRNLLSDLRYALRSLRSQPAFSATAIFTLGLGIALTTTIFGVVDGIVLRPLSFPRADRLITICEQYPGSTPDWCSISPPNVEDIAARSRSIEAIGIGRSWPYHLATTEGSEGINGGIATPGLFAALGARAQLGRLIAPADLIGQESNVVVITDQFWRTRFGAAKDVVGRSIVLDGKPVTIIGVLQQDFQLPPYSEMVIWRPLHINPRDEAHREWAGFVAYGRLRAGVDIRAARAELAGITEQLRLEHFASKARWGLQLESLQDLVVGGVKPVLLLFLGAVALVLLVACANVANLLLARASGRGAEMALRSALGASRWRIVRGLLVESFVIALCGAALGVVAADWGTVAFKALAPANVPRIDGVRVDGRVLAFALALSVATTLVFGLVPALRTARVDLAQALREGGRGSSGRSSQFGKVLVIGELALALTLTFGSALLVRSFSALTAWNPGFEREHLLTFTLFAPSEGHVRREWIPALWKRLESDLAAIPGVSNVGTASAGPLFGSREGDDVRFQAADGEHRAPARWYDVSPGFFQTLGVPLVRGRPLDETDRDGAPEVALVNESLVRRFWPNEDPIGKRISLFQDRLLVQVVGVVRDVPPVNPDTPVEPEIYWSNRQEPRGYTYFLMRTTVPPATIAPLLRARIRAIDHDLDPHSIQTMSELMDYKLKTPRFQMLLLLTFGASALLLAAVGTYGLFAYTVARRRRELGIRIALGAASRQIVGSVLRDGLVLACIGVASGIVMSVALSRVMRGMVAGITTVDPVALAVSGIVLVAIALLACLGPARRAASVDPAVTLAAE